MNIVFRKDDKSKTHAKRGGNVVDWQKLVKQLILPDDKGNNKKKKPDDKGKMHAEKVKTDTVCIEAKTDVKEKRVSTKGLMFVDVKINGKPIRALIDAGATHNFVAGTEVERLGLSLEKDSSKIKAVNSAAQPIYGVARAVPMKVCSWEGKANFTAVPMDDFQAILGLEFLRNTKTAVMPYSNSMCVMGDKPCLISTMSTTNSEKFISAMQLNRGAKRGEQTWVAVLKLDEFLVQGPVPTPVKRVLRQFADVFPEKLPQELPPRRGVDHAIDLVPGAKPPARAPYRMAIPELEELCKQLKELLDAGFIRPSKAPYGASVLF